MCGVFWMGITVKWSGVTSGILDLPVGLDVKLKYYSNYNLSFEDLETETKMFYSGPKCWIPRALPWTTQWGFLYSYNYYNILLQENLWITVPDDIKIL